MTRAVPEALDTAALCESLEQLERRVAALERALAGAAVPVGAAGASLLPPSGDVEAPADATQASAWTTFGTVTLVGRTLIALGGGYLLRALTEDAIVPPTVGVVSGFVYALFWLALAARTGTGPARASALFHGLTAALVAYPLAWETTARFALVTPTGGAVVLVVFTALMLLTARRCRLEALAWIGALAGTSTAIVLAVATTAFIPYTLVVTLIGVAALWLGYVDEWVGIRWPVAAAADLLVLLVTLRALDPDVVQAAMPVVALQMFVLAAYLASFVARTLVLGREVIPFEVTQSAGAMAVCFGGALAVLSHAGATATPLGLAALVLGAGAYAFAFVFVEPRRHWRNLAFFTSLAVAFSVAGVVIVLSRPAAILVIGAMAILCAEWARRTGRLTLAVHATTYAAVMAWLSGLAGEAGFALVASPSTAWPPLTLTMLLTLAIVFACVTWPVPERLGNLESGTARTLRLVRLGLLAAIGAGVAVALSVPLLTAPAGAGAHAGIVATLRTTILAAIAILIAALPRRASEIERNWLAYGLLAVIGLKLLGEDLPRGRPATLFIALAVYGAALIVIPRLARAAGRHRTGTPSPVPPTM